MRNGRSRIREEEGRFGEILRSVRDTFAGTLRDTLKQIALGILHRGMMLLIVYALAAASMVFGVVMLLNGVLHGLRSIPLSEAAAYSIVGSFALAAGLVLLLVARSRGAED